MVTKQNQHKKQALLIVSIVIYLLCVIYITLLSRSSSLSRHLTINLFRSYRLWFSGNRARGRAILQNIALFIPCGYLFSAAFLLKRYPIIVGIFISLTIEITQYYTGRGLADIDDLLDNAIGVVFGDVMYLVMVRFEKRIGKRVFVVSAESFLVFLSLIGCMQMKEITDGSSPDVSQFDFRINTVESSEGLSFSGICITYYMPTPDYTIYLKSNKTVRGDTTIEGATFNVKADVPINGEYEILIKFHGFSRVSTSTYIDNGKVAYIGGNVPEKPKDTRIDGAVLKAYSSIFDTYVYEKAGYLIWLIGYDIDNSTEIIYHINSNEPEKLPENRKQYGFDNLGFHATKNETESIGHYRVFVKALPKDYKITGVTIGFSTKGKITWSHRFRAELRNGLK